MIPRTYHDGNPEDRAYASDFWSWLAQQPRDAWLLWARRANWDNAGTIFQAMVDRPDCDLGLVSWLFWASGPASCIEQPAHYRRDRLIATIVENCDRGFYGPAELSYDRSDVAISAHQYVRALREAAPGQPPFRLPRALCGPFDGRRARIPARYDDQTERDLQELFHYLNGGLPRSEEEYWRDQVASGNAWVHDQMTLPQVPADPVAAFGHLDDAAYVEAIFGKSAAFDEALARHRSGRRPRRGWWPFR
jgi:hypothetical protein